MVETIFPGVSIVVTCYNLQEYIGAALQSIQDQTYAGNIQTIVVDDASSDRSSERIAAFTNIVFERNKHNRGVLASMLTGLEHADADIIFMLDGDDIWERNKIEESVKVFVQRCIRRIFDPRHPLHWTRWSRAQPKVCGKPTSGVARSYESIR